MSVWTKPNHECQFEEIASYLDGELSGEALTAFESHLDECPRCASELRNQRLLLCTLDSAFSDTRAFQLPNNFTRVVAAHARSDVRSMRSKKEWRHAFRLCAVLALIAFALLGARTGALILQPARTFVRAAGNIFGLIWQPVYDTGAGLAVIARVMGRALIEDSHGLGLLALIPLAILAALLPHLIIKYHRARIID